MALKKTNIAYNKPTPEPTSIPEPVAYKPVSGPKVVHCKRETFDVYIGRAGKNQKPSKYGNPFSHLEESAGLVKVATREDAVESYRKWILGEIQVPGLIAPTIEEIRRDLAGKTLGCWCSPKSCHGDVLMDFANNPIYEPVYDSPSP